MKTTYIIELALSLCLSAGFNSCNYLDANEYLNEVENLNDIWTERNSIRKAWAACYGAMPNYADMVDGWPFNCNYDEAHGGLDSYKCLTFAQGKLLIKLVDRQTNSTGYELVKAFMGPFKAGFYQTFAALFGASLKKQYDPMGDDALTERVILMVESGQL